MKPALPFVGNAIHAWSQQLEFMLVGKRQDDFQTVEVFLPCKAFGVRAPLRPQELALKPEGQRAWKWEKIHASPGLVLNVDDAVIFNGVRYRVMSKADWIEYGFVEYDIVQDFQG